MVSASRTHAAMDSSRNLPVPVCLYAAAAAFHTEPQLSGEETPKKRSRASASARAGAERDSDPRSGHWSFPGGRREPEDRDLLHAALRELEEKCGICLARERLEAALPIAVARRKVGTFLLVAPFVFHVDDVRPTVLDPREAVEAVWVPLTMLRDPARHALRPVPGLPREMRFSAIDLNGVPLWGFTYRLIADWLDINRPE